MKVTTTKISWTIGTVVGLFAIVAGAKTFWDAVGWTTPNIHAADIVLVEESVDDHQQIILDAIKESRDEWKCDEYEEELLDMLREQIESDTVELRRDIEKIKSKMETLNCNRFEDFG